MARLKEQSALITGAASGIGKATAELFSAEGAEVIATDLRGPRRLDVTSEDEWIALLDALPEPPDILVANAGVSSAAPVTELALDEWRRVFSVNVEGVFLGVKHTLRRMRERGTGSIVIVSSASGIKASPNASAYCASKAALRLFAKCVALECKDRGDNIRVNTVCPGGVVTPMWTTMDFWPGLVAEHGEEGAWRALGASTAKPLDRFATAAEVAQAILFFASDESSCVTGAELAVDTGFTA